MTGNRESNTKIVHEEPGEPTTILVQPGATAVVFNADGSLDLALIPDHAQLTPIEGTDDYEANEGMLRFMAILFAIKDPEILALVKKRLEEDPDAAPPGLLSVEDDTQQDPKS